MADGEIQTRYVINDSGRHYRGGETLPEVQTRLYKLTPKLAIGQNGSVIRSRMTREDYEAKTHPSPEAALANFIERERLDMVRALERAEDARRDYDRARSFRWNGKEIVRAES